MPCVRSQRLPRTVFRTHCFKTFPSLVSDYKRNAVVRTQKHSTIITRGTNVRLQQRIYLNLITVRNINDRLKPTEITDEIWPCFIRVGIISGARRHPVLGFDVNFFVGFFFFFHRLFIIFNRWKLIIPLVYRVIWFASNRFGTRAVCYPYRECT